MSFVLDASVALAWCFADEGGAYAPEVLAALREGEAFVPAHWTLEVSNGLLVAERKRRITAQEATRVARLLLALPIAIEPVERTRDLTATYRLARTRGLSSYDAAYLELAVRTALPLATLDAELREAALAEGVELVGAAPGG